MTHRPHRHLLLLLLTSVAFGLGLTGCNDDSDGLAIDGTWTGEVTEVGFEITLMISEQGDKQITGLADVDSPLSGTVQGDVGGARDNTDVTLTIELDDVIVGGSLVFDGVLQDEDTMTGTLEGGLLGGTFPITFQRQS